MTGQNQFGQHTSNLVAVAAETCRRAVLFLCLLLAACGGPLPARHEAGTHEDAPSMYRREWGGGVCRGFPLYETASWCADGGGQRHPALEEADQLVEAWRTRRATPVTKLSQLRSYAEKNGAGSDALFGAADLYSHHGQYRQSLELLDEAARRGEAAWPGRAGKVALRAGACDLAARYRLPVLADPGTCLGLSEHCEALSRCGPSIEKETTPDGDPPFPPYESLLGVSKWPPSTIPATALGSPPAVPASVSLVRPGDGSWARRVPEGEPAFLAPSGRPVGLRDDGEIVLLVNGADFDQFTEHDSIYAPRDYPRRPARPTSRARVLRFATDGTPAGASSQEDGWSPAGVTTGGGTLWLPAPPALERAGGWVPRHPQDPPGPVHVVLREDSGSERWRYPLREPTPWSAFAPRSTLAAVSVNHAGEAVVVTEPPLLAVLHRDGSPTWQAAFKGKVDVSDVAIDDEGNVIVAGGGAYRSEIGGSAVHCPAAPEALNHDPDRNGAYWIAKLDSAGKHLWSHCSLGLANASMLAPDASGSVTVAGTFRGTLDIGGVALSALGFEDVFLVRYARDGKVLFRARVGAPGRSANPDELDDLTALALDAQGGGALALRLNLVREERLVGEALLVRFDASGAVSWTKLYPAPRGNADHRYDPRIEGLVFDRAGGLVVTGSSGARISFEATTLEAVGPGEIGTFLARIPP